MALKGLSIQESSRFELLADWKRFASMGVREWPRFDEKAWNPEIHMHLDDRKLYWKQSVVLHNKLDAENMFDLNQTHKAYFEENEDLPGPSAVTPTRPGPRLDYSSKEDCEAQLPISIEEKIFLQGYVEDKREEARAKRKEYNPWIQPDDESHEDLVKRAMKPDCREKDPVSYQWGSEMGRRGPNDLGYNYGGGRKQVQHTKSCRCEACAGTFDDVVDALARADLT